MAQELIDKIRAAAQARGIDPELALSIARAESSFDPRAKARTSSASGLFQVTKDTWKEFGGKPGRQLDPDENIRVGLDIIAKNTSTLKNALGREPRPAEVYAAHYFGPSGAKSFLFADPETPIASILGERAVKANPNLKGKTAGQVLAQLEGKVGSPASASAPAVSRETPPAPTRTPAEEIVEPALRSGMTAQAPAAQKLAALGPGYQAALALSFLSDEDEKEGRDPDTGPSVAEEWLKQTASRPAALAMGDISVKSPFEALGPQPQMLAEGGEVGEMQEGARKGEAYKALERYLQARGEMPSVKVSKYLPQGMDALFSSDNLNIGSGSVEISGRTPKEVRPSLLTHEMTHAADRQMKQQAIEQGMFGKSTPYTEAYEKLVGKEGRNRSEIARKMYPEWAEENEYYRSSPEELAAHGMGAFAGPTLQRRGPRHVDATAATELQILLDLAQRNVDKGPTGLSKIPAFFRKMGRYADGGEVEPTAEELAAASRPATVNPMIRRQGEAARRLAAMRDVNTLPDPRTYAAVTGFLGVAPDEQGFSALHPDISGIKKAGEAGFYAGTAAQVAPIAGQAAKMLGKLTGSALNERLLAGESLTPGFNTPAPINFAVKPKGGTVLHTYSGEPDNFPKSKLDHLLADYRKVASRDQEASDELVDFIKKKAPKYFTTTFGTADDPLRTAIRERAIEPFGRDIKKIPPYLVDASKFPQARGHLQAKQELERMYDEMTGARALVLKPDDVVSPGSMELRREINQKMAMEGVPVEAQNAPSVDAFSRSDFEAYPNSTEALQNLAEAQRQGLVPSGISHALNTGEVMFDFRPNMDLLSPENVVDALKQVPPNKLKNMSFPDALIQGTQALAPVRDYRAAIDMADRGAKLPPTVLQQFTKPVAPAPGGTWVQITDPVATELEGKLMKHSVGGYGKGDSYGTGYTGLPYGGKLAFDDGLVRVYSLRDKAGEPTITVEMARPKGQENWNVTQIRGRFNSEPADKESVFNLLGKIDETEGLGTIKPNSYTRSATGADTEGSFVDWGQAYALWKQGISE